MSTNKEKLLSLDAKVDKKAINHRGDSVRYIVATVSTAEQEEDGSTVRSPAINLALVLDRSGSMGGGRLENAKSAAMGIVEQLDAGDSLSLVTFESESQRLLSHVEMTEEGKAIANRTLARIRTGGSTNLSDGWLDGAEAVAEVMDERSGCINRVLLLTDGKANKGIRDLHELSDIAANLNVRGIVTSAVGIGDDYSSQQILAIAEHGGGAVHDAQDPEEIVEVVMGEFGDTRNTVAENVAIHLTLPDGAGDWRVEQVGPYRFERNGRRASSRLGSLTAGRSREVVFRVFCPAGTEGEQVELELELTYAKVGEPGNETIERKAIGLRFTQAEALRQEWRDNAVAQLVAKRWYSQVMFTAMQMNRDHDYSGASDYVRQQLRYYAPYCLGLENVDTLIRDLDRLAARIEQPINERARKEVQLHHYKSTKIMPDYRSRKRDWKQQLFETEGRTLERAWLCRLRWVDGHLISDIDGRQLLLDTGSPESFSNDGIVNFNGIAHNVGRDFMGITAEVVSGYVGTTVDALLGMDILKRYSIVVDGPRNSLEVFKRPLNGFPVRMAMSDFMNIPIIEIAIDGVERRMVVDSGAKLSYTVSGATRQQPSLGRVEDFYPGIGLFSVDTYRLETDFQGHQCDLVYGVTPPFLELMLGAMGVDGLLGSQIFEIGRVGLSFPEREFLFEPSPYKAVAR